MLPPGPRFLFLLLTVPALATGPLRAQGPDWRPYDEAASLLQLRDSSLVMDSLLLREIRDELAIIRERFPALERIRENSSGTTLGVWVQLLAPAAEEAIAAAAARAREAAPGDSSSVWLAATGYPPLDSLNAVYGASGVEAGYFSFGKPMYLRVHFRRPLHIPRLEEVYERAGIRTDQWARGIGFMGEPFSSVTWERRRREDIFRFHLKTMCMDPCLRTEDYEVRFRRSTGEAVMTFSRVQGPDELPGPPEEPDRR